jgi:hypothetical protein
VALHGKSDEISIGPKAKFPHDAVFVKSHCPHRNTQDVGGLSHGFSFGQESDDFSLTRREGLETAFPPQISRGRITHVHVGIVVAASNLDYCQIYQGVLWTVNRKVPFADFTDRAGADKASSAIVLRSKRKPSFSATFWKEP